MKNFKIDENVFKILPDYCVAIVEAIGIDNTVKNPKIDTLLNENVENFHKNFVDINIREIPNIKAYRDTFLRLNMNPNKFMCSIEALGKRVQKNNKLPHINSIVDLGNALSLKYQLAVGAHDIDKMNSDLEIRFSTKNDNFLPMGESESEIMPEGELVYSSGNTIKTRRWIWRQSDDGKITEYSNHIFFPIDGFSSVNKKSMLEAQKELIDILKSEFTCDVKVGFLDKNNNKLY